MEEQKTANTDVKEWFLLFVKPRIVIEIIDLIADVHTKTVDGFIALDPGAGSVVFFQEYREKKVHEMLKQVEEALSDAFQMAKRG